MPKPEIRPVDEDDEPNPTDEDTDETLDESLVRIEKDGVKIELQSTTSLDRVVVLATQLFDHVTKKSTT